MEKNKCNKCEHEWFPRVSDVKECPKCKSRAWNKTKSLGDLLGEAIKKKEEEDNPKEEEEILEIPEYQEEEPKPEVVAYTCPTCNAPVGKFQDCNNCGAELVWQE